MLETLIRCLDPVLRSSRQLTSADAATRMRGLEALRGLPRVVLAEPVAAEVAAAAILVKECGIRNFRFLVKLIRNRPTCITNYEFEARVCFHLRLLSHQGCR